MCMQRTTEKDNRKFANTEIVLACNWLELKQFMLTQHYRVGEGATRQLKQERNEYNNDDDSQNNNKSARSRWKLKSGIDKSLLSY